MTAADGRKLNKDAGFSLLELLIAVVILAIIVIPMLNLFLSSNRLNIKSRQTLRATTLAQDIMEGLKAYDIEELKDQFNNPTDGFYVIDDNLIKGAVAEETGMEALEVDPSTGQPCEGIYYFSLRKVSMQGSEFDALVKVDAREYMEPGPHNNSSGDPVVLNKPLGDARGIDKDNGTFVESDKIRRVILESVLKNPDIRAAMDADGVTEAMKNALTFKTLDQLFTGVSRTITVDLNQSATDKDEEGNPKIYMYVTDEYEFTYPNIAAPVKIYGDMSSLVWVKDMPCGEVSGDEVNINLFYYPLYKATQDEIVINNKSDAKLNLLIAKQVPTAEKNADEVLSDAQLMAAEMSYVPLVKINGTSGSMDTDDFTLKTNLGMNLVGKAYLTGEGLWDDKKLFNVPNQLTYIRPSYSTIQLYTLEGVRSSLGAAATDGEVTELFYNVEVSVYEEGAADKDFPVEERMIVIDGSKNN